MDADDLLALGHFKVLPSCTLIRDAIPSLIDKVVAASVQHPDTINVASFFALADVNIGDAARWIDRERVQL